MRNRNLLKSHASKILVKRIHFNQGVGVLIFKSDFTAPKINEIHLFFSKIIGLGAKLLLFWVFG